MEKFSKKFSRFTFDIPCGKMWKVLCKNTFFRKEKTSKPLSLLALKRIRVVPGSACLGGLGDLWLAPTEAERRPNLGSNLGTKKERYCVL